MKSHPNKYLPSRKFIFIALGCAAVVVLAILIKNGTIALSKKSKNSNIKAYTVSEILDGDRDGDGIRDWEEALWGTSADSADTNGDGTGDKEEVEARRAEINAAYAQNGEEELPLNETDELARDLFASIVSLSEKGALTDEAMVDLADTVSASAAGKIDLPSLISPASVAPIKSTLENKRLYAAKVTALLEKYDAKGVGREMEIYRTYLTTGDETGLAAVGPTGLEYQKFALELKALSPTEDLVETHVSLVNNLYNTGAALRNIAETENNPVIGSIGIGQYKKYYFEVEKSIAILAPFS